jgi:predicted TIM-barrel fold metal-dependent hydrolase
MLRHGINIAGSHKFIFGTDFPIINAIMQVQGVLAEHLTDAERQAVFSGNFKRLLGMAE